MHIGWAISGANQVANVMATKFDWNEDEAVFYNSLINTSSILGMCLGSIIGGWAIGKGRRKALIYANFVCMGASLLNLILNVWAIITGKFIFGIGAAVMLVGVPKMIEETVP
jgi:MFS family permease